jgi:hypothetical protein
MKKKFIRNPNFKDDPLPEQDLVPEEQPSEEEEEEEGGE